MQNDSGWIKVSLKRPFHAYLYLQGVFTLSPLILPYSFPHQNLMPLLSGKTKAQEKVKHIKGSPPKFLSFFNELLLVTPNKGPWRSRIWVTSLHFQFSRTCFQFTLRIYFVYFFQRKSYFMELLTWEVNGHLLGREALDDACFFLVQPQTIH